MGRDSRGSTGSWLGLRGVCANREKKDTGVNVAARLQLDILLESVDGTPIIFNDGDLRFLVAPRLRLRVPVGATIPRVTIWPVTCAEVRRPRRAALMGQPHRR